MTKVSLVVLVVATSFASSSAVAYMVVKAPAAGDNCNPYVKYNCLDAYLGDDFLRRLYHYYYLEWGHNAVWPVTPQSTPPMPFTEWP